MNLTMADPAAPPADPAAGREAGRAVGSRAPRRTVPSGQIVVSQAAVAVWLLSAGQGVLPAAAGTALAAVVLTATWVRLRRRPLYRWLGLLARYLARRRTLAAGAAPDALLRWLHPGARVVSEECDGTPAGVVADAQGRTVLLELDDPAELLVDTAQPVPPLATLLPAAGTGPAGAGAVSLRLVVTGGPAPALRAGGGAAATSYRQLTEGRLLASQRAVLAVRIEHPGGGDGELSGGDGELSGGDGELSRALASALRRVRRRLGTARVLAEPAVLTVLADLAHHEPGRGGREAWQGVHLGGLVQATYLLRRWPPPADLAGLVPRLWALPAAATTVALYLDAGAAAMAIRLAAPDASALAVAAQALRRLLGGYHAAAQRLDGEHARGFAATLPAGGPLPGPPAPVAAAGLLPPPLGGAGVALGVDRHGELVTVRLFRSAPTRAVLVGGVRAAQLVTLRALALGAQVVVQSTRPQVWEPFIRGASIPGEAIALVPPGRAAGVLRTAGTPLAPQLVVVDAGAAATGDPAAAWRTILVVREDLGFAEVDVLARADLVVLQPLPPAQAGLAASALGLDGVRDWLTRIRGDMVGIVNRRSVRWALLSPTQVEQGLIGRPARD